MGRIAQRQAERGSQKWLQVFVNESPERLAAALECASFDCGNDHVEWLSPLKGDDYAEYRDQAFLDRLGLVLHERPLREFWPGRGPVWDGLGRTTDGRLLLVEAKAHIAEVHSPPTQASPASKQKINKALDEVRSHLGVRSPSDWSGPFYQYTNRLAHLYLLRVLNGLPAHLVFVYFVGDADMGGPETVEEWKGAIKLLETYLGIRSHALAPYIHDVFVDV